MMKKNKNITSKEHVVLFVEGDTDLLFFNALLDWYRKTSSTPILSCEVRNLQGVSRYSSKVMGKIKNEIKPAATAKGMGIKAICCSYDTDVFEASIPLNIDWKKMERDVLALGIQRFCRIEVNCMIEDWILDDIKSICQFLKLKEVPAINGNTGYQRIQSLFRKARKIYTKGLATQNIIKVLDFGKIRGRRLSSLSVLEEILNVSI